MSMKRLTFLIIACAILGGCEDKTAQQLDSETRTDPALLSHLQQDATEVLTIGSNSFVLEAYLWRDFMPFGGLSDDELARRNGLISINRLVEVNSARIPDNITLVKQYVVYGNMIWETTYEDETGPEQPPYKIEKISHGGPKWDTGIKVDVIAEVRNSKNGKSYYISCKGITVIRTS